jgi:flagellar biogenesis protein FliO
MPPGQVIAYIIGTLIIIFGAYYVTYFIGVKASGQSRGRLRNRNINLVDRFAISRDKSFCIIEIAGKVYVVGITNQTMTLLDTLDAAAFAETASECPETPVRTVVPVGKYTSQMTRKLAAFIAKKMGRTLETDEGADGVSFAESMKTAREKDRSGQTGQAEDGRTDDKKDEE